MDIDAYPRCLDLGLDRIKALLIKLGSPEKNLKNIIHIAGTNGKGSTQAILASILMEAGYTVHCFTSPHLIKVNERITLAGEPVSDDLLDHYERHVKKHIPDKGKIGFFEMLTAMAFCAFADHPADFVILETGLGGRFDATNVIEDPLLTIITKIGLDHQQSLGNSLAQIAGEKAGILKKNVPLITCLQEKEVMNVFEEKAKSLEVSTHIAETNFPFTYAPKYLKADYQEENAAMAVKAAEILDITDSSILEKGVNNAFIAGRMQLISEQDGFKAWVDGAHNVDGARALSYEIAKWQEKDPTRKICISLALLKNRDPEVYIKALTEKARIDDVTIVKNLTGLDLDRFHDFGNFTFGHQEYDSLDALTKFCKDSEITDLIFTGSLSYIGYILDLSKKHFL
jgi:dihydrofolate synthase/folylpolyglutamate synthase